MDYKMEKANMIAENLHCLIKLVNNSYEKKSNIVADHNKLYRLKNLLEEYKFQVLADELSRVNQFVWDRKVSYLIIGRINDKIKIVDEYIHSNYNDLFFFSPRVDNIKSIICTFGLEEYIY